MSVLSQPGGGQWGGAQAEVWETLQWGDRNPPEGCSQLYDRPWQGRGYDPPPTRAFQVQSSEVEISHCLRTPSERCSLQSRFSSPLFNLWRQSILFSPPPACPPREVHQRASGTIVFSSFYSHSYVFSQFSCCLLNVDIFKRATLSEMVSRRGTSSTHARLSRGKVIPSYVSSTDVLLTAIDFHLFIFTLRIWSPPLFFNLKTEAVPQWETLLCWNSKFDLTVFLPRLSVLVNLLSSSYLCGHTGPHHPHKLKANDSTYCLMLPYILSVWIGISFEQFYSDKSL